jgi:hypothetical protein
LKELLTISPDFIPAKVYEYQLESNSSIKAELLENLKQKYPEHWIVKQLK